MTDRTKTICPPIFDLGGIKKFEKLPSRDTYLFNSFKLHVSLIITFKHVFMLTTIQQISM